MLREEPATAGPRGCARAVGSRLEVQHGYLVSDAELDAVIRLYDAYDAARGAPDELLKGLELDQALRVAIKDAYDLTQVGRRLASIRTNLFKDVERCPICGISGPRALDDHLPKASYHPLAIYVRNLVPLCTDCNQLNSTAASDNPAQRFVHPYFGELPNARFLRAEVTLNIAASLFSSASIPRSVCRSCSRRA